MLLHIKNKLLNVIKQAIGVSTLQEEIAYLTATVDKLSYELCTSKMRILNLEKSKLRNLYKVPNDLLPKKEDTHNK